MPIVSDAEAFKALGHPLRVRILKYLDVEGSATATALGAALGTTSGTTSYHLRRLERHGFVEDDPERSSGRERWWRWAGGKERRIVFADFGELDDITRAAAEAADAVLFADDHRLMRRMETGARALGPWARGVRAGRYMTSDQLAAFTAEFRTVLDRHSAPHADQAPPGARAIELRFFALPTEEPTSTP